jgi:transmembrane sensor
MARTTESAGSLSQEAAHWWTMLHDDGASTADRRAFLAWVSRSPERIEAYLEMARLMSALRSDAVHWPDTPAEELIREARASNGDVTPLPIGRNADKASQCARSEATRWSGVGMARWRPWVGAAAGVAAAAIAIFFGLKLPTSGQYYETKRGEQRSVLLADGSRVTLDSASSVEVTLRAHRRILHLTHGEALFEVSHDPGRPFDVYADGTVVRAIGTEFNVDMRSPYPAVTVTVLRGRVAVMRASQEGLAAGPSAASPPTASGEMAARPKLVAIPAPAGALILDASEQVVVTSSGAGVPQRVPDPTAVTAWTRRQLVFEHRPLGEVVDELNGYGGPRIVVESASLRKREVTGVIQLDDPDSFLSFLSDAPGVVIRRAGDGTSIVTIRGDATPAGPPR